MKRPNITPGVWADNAGTVWMQSGCAVVHPHTGTQTITNAQAIAALPDLLAALEQTTYNLRDAIGDAEELAFDARAESHRECLKIIKEALTKAGYTF